MKTITITATAKASLQTVWNAYTQAGWQAILNNFKRYTENISSK